MNNKVNAILNQIETIKSNMNKKIQPFQDSINSVQRTIDLFQERIRPIQEKMKVIYAEKSLTDEGLETFEQIEILNHSLELSDIKKYTYFEKNTRNRKLEFITLLKNINRNHIQKDTNDNYVYSFINELFTSREDILTKLKEIKADQKKFNYLNKKYSIKATKEYQKISNSTLHRNQVKQFLYLMHHDEYKDIDSIRVIFSILFYDVKEQKSFTTKLNGLEKATNNVDFYIYNDFLQYIYLDKN
ncbi:MAG TPA: hypothetical protein EYG70_01360 [Sulfurimonas sp.]|nr:hypothetical protein [Sulfurimonas sp.]